MSTHLCFSLVPEVGTSWHYKIPITTEETTIQVEDYILIVTGAEKKDDPCYDCNYDFTIYVKATQEETNIKLDTDSRAQHISCQMDLMLQKGDIITIYETKYKLSQTAPNTERTAPNTERTAPSTEMVKFLEDKGFKNIAAKICEDLHVTHVSVKYIDCHKLGSLGSYIVKALLTHKKCAWLSADQRLKLVRVLEDLE